MLTDCKTSRAISKLTNIMYGKMKEFLQKELADIREAGLYKEERIIASPQRAEIEVGGKKVLNFCANNYLGLSDNPRLVEAAKKEMDARGYGMSSVRFICGTQDIHKELEAAIAEYFGTVIVVSHDRHFLNNVCTHTVDIDYTKIKMYVGNYEFWYESSQLIQKMLKQQNKKNEEKIKELQSFIQRFSANKSKSKQATSRKKLIDKLTVEELPASSRRYPFISFDMEREIGKDILQVEGLTKTVDGVKVLDHVSFTVGRNDKIAFVGDNEIAVTTLFKILMGEEEPDEGFIKWGSTASVSYFPQDNSAFFNGCKLSILDWIRQYSKDETETYLRGFLGRMLFSGDDIFKNVDVLSGGEKVRCMFSRMMLFQSNVLILDRPTNHLDLESITAVNNGLSDFKGNVLFASHDYEIVQTVANRIIEIADKGCYDRQGTYEEYVDWRKANHGGSFTL